MNAIEVIDLDFEYSNKQPLIQDLNMNIPHGGIYGFLGPNGAGKTTTLKLILNLLKFGDKGTINVLGKNIGSNYPIYLNQLGSLIEEASVYHHLTAVENLKIWSNYNNTNATRVEEVLEIIGLSHTGKKKVKFFSTGMKQRLGIGIAILHDPEVLILDEPTNGLDPVGLGDLRKMMQNFTAQGKTILLSSHMLSEVEKMADHIGIIKNGNIIFEGTLAELNKRTAQASNVFVVVGDNEKAKAQLDKSFRTKIVDDHLEISISSKEDINEIVKLIIEKDILLYEVIQPKQNLESLFMKLSK